MTSSKLSFGKHREVHSRGYTMIEVMMALAILAVGAVGVISLQKVTVMGGLNARNLTSASNVASGWVEIVQGEATSWNSNTNADMLSDATDMPLLTKVLTTPDTWVDIPIGAPVKYAQGGGTTLDGTSEACSVAANCSTVIAYCSQVRGHLLGPINSADTAEIEVRTFFSRAGGDVAAECALGAAAVNTALANPLNGTLNGNSRYNYGFVYVTGTVRRNTL